MFFMKKNNIEVETYVFVGDEYTDEAHRVVNGKVIGKYTKSGIIKTLKSNSKFIMSGTKLKSPIDSEFQSYLIEYGNDKNVPKEIIKIVTKKEALIPSDPYVVEIEKICQNSIRVRMKEKTVRTLAAISAVLVTVGISYGMVKLIEEDSKNVIDADKDYISSINSEREEKGLSPLGEEKNEDPLMNVEFDFEDHQRSR